MIKKGKNRIVGLILSGLLIIIIGLTGVLKVYKKESNTHPNIFISLVEFADSIRNSKPDSALCCYNQVIRELKNSTKGEKESHVLALAYVGLANVYSDKGDYKLAIWNDSIALDIASRSDNQLAEAKALVSKGITLFRLGEYEKAMDSYQKVMELAVELNDFELQAKIAANRAMIYFYQGDNQKTIDGFKKALEIGKQIKNDGLIAGNYMNLAIVYSNLSQNDSVLVYYQKALDLFITINDKNGELLCYQNLGNIYYDTSDYGKAITNFQHSLDLAVEMDDKSNISKGYHNLAEVYSHLGDTKLATDLLDKSIKIEEGLGDKLSLGKGYIAVGDMYYTRDDYPKAHLYYRKSLKLFLELKNSKEIGHAYGNMASVYSSEQKSDSAVNYYTMAVELYKQVGNTVGLSNLYINLGDEYRLEKVYDQSEKLLLQALKLKKDLEDEEGTAMAKNHLANLYLAQAEGVTESIRNIRLLKAEEAGLESYKTGKRLKTLPVIKEASGTLMKVYKKLGMYSKALEYSETFNSLSDSILNKSKIEALTFAEARWNVEKKQQEIDHLENTRIYNEQIIRQKEIETRQHKFIIRILIALSMLIGISVLIFALYVKKRRDALYQKQLAKMTGLRMQNARNTMSPHFFFNVLGSLSVLTGQPETLKLKIRSLTLLLRKVIENIDQSAVPLESELEAIKAFVDLYQQKIPDPFEVEYKIAEGSDLKKMVPAMMIQIPVENAIKHGLMPLEGEKKLSISVTGYDDYQQITVTDNGIGRRASAGSSTGTGTGLKVLMQTIHLLNNNNRQKIRFSMADYDPDNHENPGTSVNIEIPHDFDYTLYKE